LKINNWEVLDLQISLFLKVSLNDKEVLCLTQHIEQGWKNGNVLI
jgi:3-methyladenine DNA glycosylase AlkD